MPPCALYSPRFALGASNVCLVGENPDVLRPGTVGIRGSMVVGLRPRLILITPHPSPLGTVRALHFFIVRRVQLFLLPSSALARRIVWRLVGPEGPPAQKVESSGVRSTRRWHHRGPDELGLLTRVSG